jgi:hypothetical protein
MMADLCSTPCDIKGFGTKSFPSSKITGRIDRKPELIYLEDSG